VELGLDNARDDLIGQYAEILGVSVNEAEEQVGGAGFEDVAVVVLASLLQTVKSLSEAMKVSGLCVELCFALAGCGCSLLSHASGSVLCCLLQLQFPG
jgi:hypothetical protein